MSCYTRPPLPEGLHCNICGEVKPLVATEFQRKVKGHRQIWTLALCVECKSQHMPSAIPGRRTTA
jgi:hypothetical protein